jgi:uncharacterized membrane-anchored protein
MTLVELLVFAFAVFFTVIAGRFLSHWIGVWAFIPAIVTGSVFVFAILVMLVGDFRRLWRTSRESGRKSRHHHL